MKQPRLTPMTTGQPKTIVRGIRQSATRSCMGPKDIGAKTMTRTAYNPARTTVKVMSLVFNSFASNFWKVKTFSKQIMPFAVPFRDKKVECVVVGLV